MTITSRPADPKSPKPPRIQIHGVPYDCDYLTVAEVIALRSLENLGQVEQLIKATSILTAALNRAGTTMTVEDLRTITTAAEVVFLADLLIRMSYAPNAATIPPWNRENA